MSFKSKRRVGMTKMGMDRVSEVFFVGFGIMGIIK